MALVVDAVTGLPWDGLPPRSLDPRVERAARHLESNVGGRTPNGELARMAAMSTNAFIRLFTAETGLSPQAFGLARRMDRACILLHHTDQSIDAIAESLGFWDRNYFTKMFRKYRDTAPAAFRKRRAHGG
jgi:transcriptional regulator GlxA family with amidase domain